MTRRIALRVLAGFGLYLPLDFLWLWLGGSAGYDALVRRISPSLRPLITDLPLSGPAVGTIEVHNAGHALVLLAAFALVVDLPWRRRVGRYLMLAGSVFVAHVAADALQTALDLALQLQKRIGIPVLLPWEIEALRRAFQLLFVYGLQIAGFLAVVLTALWSAGGARAADGAGDAPEQPSSRARPARVAALVTAGAAAALAATLAGAAWVREHDVRHARVHVAIGDDLVRDHELVRAEAQYRAALRGAGTDGDLWLRLAAVIGGRGERARAIRLLETALERVDGPSDRARIEQALALLRSAAPAGAAPRSDRIRPTPRVLQVAG